MATTATTDGTTPTVLDPALHSDGNDTTRALRQHATTALAVAAPILFTLSNVLLPDVGHTTAAVVAHVPAVASRFIAGHLLYAVASLLLLPLAVALWRIDARRGSVLRLVGGGLLVLGAASNAFGEIADGYSAWAGQRAQVPAAAQVRLLDTLDNSAVALPVSFVAIPVLSLGLTLLMVGVWRAKVVPAWLPLLTLIGGLVSGVVGVGWPALVGLVWAVPVAVVVLRTQRARRTA